MNEKDEKVDTGEGVLSAEWTRDTGSGIEEAVSTLTMVLRSRGC